MKKSLYSFDEVCLAFKWMKSKYLLNNDLERLQSYIKHNGNYSLIGSELNLSRERIRQIISKLMHQYHRFLIYEAGKALTIVEKLALPVDALVINTRGEKALTNLGIKTIKDLVLSKERELIRVPGVGDTTLELINRNLGGYLLRLGMTSEEIDARIVNEDYKRENRISSVEIKILKEALSYYAQDNKTGQLARVVLNI